MHASVDAGVVDRNIIGYRLAAPVARHKCSAVKCVYVAWYNFL